jgi:Domain of unknown function (DUF4303)
MDKPHAIITIVVACLLLILGLLIYRRRGKPVSARIDWPKFETELSVALEAEIERLATEHPRETFYSVALDCNAAYCDILLCANTPKSLSQSASSYLKDNPHSTLEAELEQLRWGLGDWKYHAFAVIRPAALGDLVELDESHAEHFLLSACRALRRAERSPALSQLKKSPDFRVACIDHDEDIVAGDRRLNSVRVDA